LSAFETGCQVVSGEGGAVITSFLVRTVVAANSGLLEERINQAIVALESEGRAVVSVQVVLDQSRGEFVAVISGQYRLA
jgi:hypothetical protein